MLVHVVKVLPEDAEPGQFLRSAAVGLVELCLEVRELSKEVAVDMFHVIVKNSAAGNNYEGEEKGKEQLHPDAVKGVHTVRSLPYITRPAKK